METLITYIRQKFGSSDRIIAIPASGSNVLTSDSNSLKASKLFQNSTQCQLLKEGYPTQSIESAILQVQSIDELQSKYRSSTWTCRQVVLVYAKKMLDGNQKCNYLAELILEEALAIADLQDLYFQQTGLVIGPLHGVPIAFSDELNIRGIDTALGCACGTLKPSSTDSAIVELLKAAGAIPLCKTNCPWHLIFSAVTNPLLGKTTNGKNDLMSLGGRCGALAVFVAQSTHSLIPGNMFIGIGTDQDGGLRVPANNAGVFTLKPTSKRVSLGTDKGLWDTISSTPGIMTKNFENLESMAKILMSDYAIVRDIQIPPLPFRSNVYSNGTGNKKLIIGFFVDDDLVRASPAAKRAVYLAAAALHDQGHTIIRFIAPSTKKAFMLMSKLYAWDKTKLSCLKASVIDQVTVLASIFPSLNLLKIPRFIQKVLGYIFGKTMNDQLLADFSWFYGGGSNQYPRSLKEYNELLIEKEEYSRLFATAWKQPMLDALICPVHAVPPMPNKSDIFTWIGSFYSALFNLLDYPAGVVPRVVNVMPGDVVANAIQYVHNDRYIPQVTRSFNLWGVLAMEEVNASIKSGTILGEPVGVQVVGKPFDEEKVLSVMNILRNHFNV